MPLHRPKNLLVAIKYFYREYTVYNLIFTAIGLYFILAYGYISFIYVFWIKVFGYGFLTILYLLSQRKYLYFFHNLGIGTLTLFTSSIALDALITLSIFFIAYKN